MYLIPIAWLYVVLMMAVAEAMSAQGTLLGAFFTLLLYGLLPLGIVMYILGSPARRRARLAAEAREVASAAAPPDSAPQGSAPPDSAPPDGSGHAADAGVAAERKEP